MRIVSSSGFGTAILRSALLVACVLFAGFSTRAAAAARPCCQITSIDTRSGTVTAQDQATGQTFQFAVTDTLLLFTLKVGQSVSADLATRRVTAAGRTACCPIVTVSPSAPSRTSRSALAVEPPAAGTAPASIGLPKIAVMAGPPTRTIVRRETHWELRRLNATVDGKPTEFEVLHLRGIKGIETADRLPDAARQFLLAHAGTLPPDDVGHYVVNLKLVEAWAKTHSVPESLKKKSVGGGHSDCSNPFKSTHCAGEAVKHAENEVAKQADALRKQAGEEWSHLSREIAHDLKMAEDLAQKCVSDQTLASGPRRVSVSNLSTAATLPIDLPGKDGRVSGKARIAVRRIDLKADVEVAAFVIPCAFVVTAFPAWVRPKSVAVNGTLTVASAIDLELHSRGDFQKNLPMPLPTAPVQIVPPIVILVDEIPVELDIGLEYEGQVAIEAHGALDATLRAEDEQTIPLNFLCDGRGCRRHGEPPPATPAAHKPSAELQLNARGRATITPSVYPALRLDVNLGALAARIGPEVYVTADFRGAAGTDCAGAGTAIVAGLAADVFGGVNLRYVVEFLRPELPGAESAAKSATIKGQSPLSRQKLASFPVGTPPVAAQSTKSGSASAPCPSGDSQLTPRRIR